MGLPKRQEPSGGFLDRGALKHRKDDVAAIYESTLEKLRLGARLSSPAKATRGTAPRQGHRQAPTAGSGAAAAAAAASEGQHVPAAAASAAPQGGDGADSAAGHGGHPGGGRCYACLTVDARNACTHCGRGICDTCSQQCDGCGDVFCTLCSQPNYDEQEDRTFCLECTRGEAPGRRQPPPSPLQGVHNPGATANGSRHSRTGPLFRT